MLLPTAPIFAIIMPHLHVSHVRPLATNDINSKSKDALLSVPDQSAITFIFYILGLSTTRLAPFLASPRLHATSAALMEKAHRIAARNAVSDERTTLLV